MKIDVKIRGIDRLLDELRSIGGNADEALHKGLLKGAASVQRKAKKMCPFNHGELRRSIKVTSEKPLEVSVGTNNEYASYVEFGTGNKGDPAVQHVDKDVWWVPADQVDPADAERYHLFLLETKDGKAFYQMRAQAPQPFLSTALRESEENVRRHVMQQLHKAIEEATGNG